MTHLSSEQLDLLELGSLSAEESQRAREHLAGCPACAQAQQKLQADAAHFRQFVQPRTLEAATRTSRRTRLAWPRWSLALAGAALVLVGVFLTQQRPPEGTENPYVAVRGEGTLSAVVARGASQTALSPGDTLQAGDRLRFQVDGAGASHVLIVSRDPVGEWSVYAPIAGEQSLRLEPGSQFLPGAVVLDSTRGHEELFALFSDQPLISAEVLAELGRGTAPASVRGVRAAASLPFEKR